MGESGEARSEAVFRAFAARRVRDVGAVGEGGPVQGDGRDAASVGRHVAEIRPAREGVRGSRRQEVFVMDDRELRLFAFREAKRLEGERASTDQVLEAAEWIYEFLT